MVIAIGDSSGDHAGGHDRGQLVLIAAITIAFILLGVVVVFNGVLYTQTLSSSASTQTVSDTDRTMLEVTDGVCAVSPNGELDDAAMDDLQDRYPSVRSGSTAAAVTIEYTHPDNSTVNVTVTYASTDLEFTRTETVDLEDCPEEVEA
ncbi:DUF7261 family protein [Natronosalvus vescus]|uniref:DUF7261 family protein n=1 Tax=Natronosalvus vescus TaxID=2953881 RepID=UPI0020915612|nr:hypothetical protein [Natronosalvus vescus]